MSESKEVQHLLSRVGDLKRQLREAELALQEARCRVAGVAVGHVVRRGDALGRVAKVEAWSHGKPWVTVNPKKKDGTWSTATRNWFTHWEHAPEAAA